MALHLLQSPTNPQSQADHLVVDFQEIYSLPEEYLRRVAEGMGSRWRLDSPYLEHFSQAFARMFMRVALPQDLPKFA